MFFLIRIAIVVLALLIVEFYFFRRIFKSSVDIFPSIGKRKLKRIMWGSIIYVNLYPLFLIALGIYAAMNSDRSVFSIESPLMNYLLIYPFWIFLTLMLQSVVYFVIADLLRLIALPFYKNKREVLRKNFHRAVLIIAAVFVVYVPSRVVYDLNSVEVNEYIYDKKDLPEELDDFKIVLIADVQADQYTNEARLQNYVDEINALNPDLVLIAGDIITSTPKYINTAAEFIGKINSKNGVYACVGDHDNWAYRNDYKRSVREITDALAQFGIEMIDNENRTIKTGESKIGITFVTDNYVTRIPDEKIDSLASANNLDFKILVTHQPNRKMVNKAVEHSYNLLFAGHTHGGQISLLFPFIDLSVSLIETTFVKGDFIFDDMLMVVNGGLGLSIAPIRYNSTAEISLIKLKNK